MRFQMPTQTKSDPLTDSIETATEKVAKLGQRAVATSKKTGSVLLDAYEKTVDAVAESYVKAARSSNLEWASTLALAQADVAREVARSYTGAARTFVD
jgi:hypothetical protein